MFNIFAAVYDETECGTTLEEFEGFVNSSFVSQEKLEYVTKHNLQLDCMWVIKVPDEWKVIFLKWLPTWIKTVLYRNQNLCSIFKILNSKFKKKAYIFNRLLTFSNDSKLSTLANFPIHKLKLNLINSFSVSHHFKCSHFCLFYTFFRSN